MRSAGFAVVPGNVYPLTDCAALISIFGTCFGTNPASFYSIIEPPVERSFIDPYYAAPFQHKIPPIKGVPRDCSSSRTCIDVSQFYQFTDTQAILVVISLPPQGAYFGYQSNVFTHYVETNGTSPDPARDIVFGSIGDAINNQVIVNQTGRAAFGTAADDGPQVAFITTASSTLDQSLRQLFKSVNGGRDDIVFTEPVWSKNNLENPGMVTTGMTEIADDWWTWIRYSLPNPAYIDGAQQWFANVGDYIRVYKISSPPIEPNVLFGPVNYTAKQANTEIAYTDALSELGGLLARYLATAQNAPVDIVKFQVSETTDISGVPTKGAIGQLCIQNLQNCMGTSEDTDAYRQSPAINLDAGQTLFVIGVDHAATGNAAYLNVAVTDNTYLEGVASMHQVAEVAGFTDGTLGGSAAAILSGLGLLPRASSKLLDELPYLYAIMLTRNSCPIGFTFCTQLGTELPTGVPYSDTLKLIERAYLKPGTTTGGNPNMMLNPILIK